MTKEFYFWNENIVYYKEIDYTDKLQEEKKQRNHFQRCEIET